MPLYFKTHHKAMVINTEWDGQKDKCIDKWKSPETDPCKYTSVIFLMLQKHCNEADSLLNTQCWQIICLNAQRKKCISTHTSLLIQKFIQSRL